MRRMTLRSLSALLVISFIFMWSQSGEQSRAGAVSRSLFCSALLKVLSTRADAVDTAVNVPKKPTSLTSHMVGALTDLVSELKIALEHAPNVAARNALQNYVAELVDTDSPARILREVWSFDSRGSKKQPLAACRGQYKYIVSPAAPFLLPAAG
ncbi:MAG: hypothetical protein WCA31_12185 [Acidimicrobiales bacterium]